MKNNIFEYSGLKGIVQIRFENDSVFISEEPKKDALIFKDSDLMLISQSIHPWMIQGCRTGMEINFTYNDNGRQKKKSIILSSPEKNAIELLDFLQDRYGDICRIRPTEKERVEMFSPAYSATYRLHDLRILTPLGVMAGLLIIFVLVLYLMMATTDQAIMPDPGKMNRAGIVIMMLGLIFLAMMHLITTRRFMAARTDPNGLAVRKIFRSRHYPWAGLTIKAQKQAVHKVYRGLYCEASDHGEVVAAKALVDIRLSPEDKTEIKLTMPVDEAGRFYRELYYRNKVSLEEAKQNGAFP
ncbi:MAG: hypothetical protein ABFD63_08015 [Smithella sp.]